MTGEEKFWSKVNICGKDMCWEWRGKTSVYGYGLFWQRFKSKYLRAHRCAWVLTYGNIPPGMFVLHKCDNKKCVNPNHLYVGDHLDNVADYKKSGGYTGERNSNAKLRDKDILEIRDMATKGMTYKKIGETFGVDRRTISAIICGENWTHVY